MMAYSIHEIIVGARCVYCSWHCRQAAGKMTQLKEIDVGEIRTPLPYLRTGFQFCAADRKEENQVSTNHRQALEKLI